MAIGPIDGDMAEIINNTNSGEIIGFEDSDDLKSVILDYYNSYKNGDLNVNSDNIEQYHRKSLTKELSQVIKNLQDK